MQREFLQEKSLNVREGNAEKSFDVDLSAKSRLIPYSTAADMLSLNNLYLEERDACETYRMVFTVNPICTNVLFNAVTEPVYMEGSDSAITLVETEVSKKDEDIFQMHNVFNQSGDTVDQIAAIRDTEYSHEKIGNFVYHCGYDIFNNHLLRTREFEHVQMDETNDHKNEEFFNTIFDYAVDYSGKTVTSVIGESTGPFIGIPTEETARTDIRMYQLDTIKPFNAAFYDGLRLVDGWYGFYNSGYINVPNGSLVNPETNKKEEIYLNRILNNESPCGFIDMYPDRSLYSFIPKPNRYRRRLERNWDCTIVYPYESDYDLFNKINENNENAVKILKAKVVYNNVGDELIQFSSLLRHSLTPGDEIRIFYRTEDSDEITRYSIPVTVISVGNSKNEEANRFFTVKYRDISSFCMIDDDTKEILKYPEETHIQFFYKRVEGGYDDRYYFRKFKKIKNYQYIECDEKPGAVVVTKEPTFINETSPDVIKFGDSFFEKVDFQLNYTQNKIAFAENIYGDRVAQVIFNDDISIFGLKDNIGRNLSKVYFMVEKTNRGYKEWYGGNVSADTVEYSHCFGKVTSGLDLPSDEGSTDYNVRKLHNVIVDDCPADFSEGLAKILEDVPTGDYSGTPEPIEDELALDSYEEFYGDIIEFSKVNFLEKTIEKVYHRFNTAQRECVSNTKYFDIHYDDLIGDLFDVSAVTESQMEGYGIGEFIISSYTLNVVDDKDFPGNIAPEGYFYSPFYDVQLKELNDELSSITVKRINFITSSASVDVKTVDFYDPNVGVTESKEMSFISIKSPVQYGIILHQPFCIYDVEEDTTYRGYLDHMEGTNITIATEAEIVSDDLKKGRYIVSFLEDNAPTYAEFIPSTQKLIWREPKKMSELENESQLYNMPFTNGRLYIHKNVDVFVRRQDPHNDFKLLVPSVSNPLRRYQIQGNGKLDFDYVQYIIDSMVDAC